jgi:Flp pilus assembly protein TadG
MNHLARGDDGNAIIEFVVAALLLLVPLTLGAASFSVLHSAHMAVQGATREAARAYGLAKDDAEGRASAMATARMVVADHGVRATPRIAVVCAAGCAATPAALAERAIVRAEVTVTLPLLALERTVRAEHMVTTRLP